MPFTNDEIDKILAALRGGAKVTQEGRHGCEYSWRDGHYYFEEWQDGGGDTFERSETRMREEIAKDEEMFRVLLHR